MTAWKGGCAQTLLKRACKSQPPFTPAPLSPHPPCLLPLRPLVLGLITAATVALTWLVHALGFFPDPELISGWAALLLVLTLAAIPTATVVSAN